MTNPPEKSHAGRLVVFLDRVEDGIPGRVAFGVHRGRTVGRSTAIDGMRLLEAWARRRVERLATVAPQHRDDPEIDLTGDNAPEPSADAHLAAMTRPDESWTKGRIYDLARALDLEGRDTGPTHTDVLHQGDSHGPPAKRRTEPEWEHPARPRQHRGSTRSA